MPGGARNRKSATAVAPAADPPVDDGIYTIEKIIKHKNDKKKGRLFFIKWQGWTASHNTWEPEDNILDKGLLEKYLAENATPATKKRGKRSAESSVASEDASSAPQRPRLDSDVISNDEPSYGTTPSPEINELFQTEGHFDRADEDKESKTDLKPVNPVAEGAASDKVEKPAEEKEHVIGEKKEEGTDVVQNMAKPPTVASAPAQPPQTPQDLPRQTAEGEAHCETDEFKITKQEHPDCSIKIQVNSQPIVTLPGEGDSSSNLASVPMTGAAASLAPSTLMTETTTVTVIESNNAGGAGGTVQTLESQTTTWTDTAANEHFEYNAEFEMTQVVSDNVSVNLIEM